MLYAAYDLKYISHKEFKDLEDKVTEIAKIIASFRRNMH